MEKRSRINWILAELPGLCEKGVISEETSEQLEKYYRERFESLPSPQKTFSLVLGLIGIVMISAGIILFVNHNWDIFPKYLRIGISSVPLALGAGISYFTLLKQKGQLWKECSAVLTSTGAAVLIGMLSQIYQLHGELHEFLFLVLLLAVPVLYIFNSIALATLYVFFSFFINRWDAPCWWSLCVIFAFAPLLFWNLRKSSVFKVWSRYLALFAAISLSANCGKYAPGLVTVMLSSLFLIAGWDLFKQKTAFLQNPWLLPAFAVQCTVLGIGSSTEKFFKVFKCTSSEYWTWWIFFAAVCLITLYTLWKKRLTIERILPVMLILLSLIPFATKEPVMRIVYNVYFGIAGIICLRNGFVRRSLLLFNGGALLITVLLACRFFDTDIGLLYRSLGFILLGLGFIFANVIYNKKSQRG